MEKKESELKKRKWRKEKKNKMGKYITFEKRARRAEDMTPEDVQRERRYLTKMAKVVKNQMTTKELKKLKKKGLAPRPQGTIVEGDLTDSAQVGREFRPSVRISKR